MAESLIGRPSIIREASMVGENLSLRIILYDTVELPPIAEPVLELTLGACADVDAVRTQLPVLQDEGLWSLERETVGGAEVVIFGGAFEDLLTVRCQRVAIRRRAFRDTEWRELCEAYERWVRREIASNRHLEKATNVLETAMAQRQDRAERILAAKPPDSGAGKGAAGRLGLLVELREILRAALEEGA